MSAAPASETAPNQASLVQELERAIAPLENRLLTPALVIDLDRVDHNIRRVIAEVGAPERWRPHVKTLKQSRLLRMLMERGINTFKCATLDEMALVFDSAERVDPDGRADVLWARSAPPPALEAALALLEDHEGARLTLLADAPDDLERLIAHPGVKAASRRVGIMLDVDVGLRRSGSSPEVWQSFIEANKGLRKSIKGLHAYEGHLRAADTAAVKTSCDVVAKLAATVGLGKTGLVVTSGSPTFLHAAAHDGLRGMDAAHQVSPGTVVLGDVQTEAELPKLELRSAAFVVATVIGLPGQDRITTDAGTKSLSPDHAPNVGRPLALEQTQIALASEEHLVLTTGSRERPARDARVWFVPQHVCTTVNLFRQVVFVRKGQLLGIESVEAHSRTTDRRELR